jgi:hypothetical protein
MHITTILHSGSQTKFGNLLFLHRFFFLLLLLLHHTDCCRVMYCYSTFLFHYYYYSYYSSSYNSITSADNSRGDVIIIIIIIRNGAKTISLPNFCLGDLIKIILKNKRKFYLFVVHIHFSVSACPTKFSETDDPIFTKLPRKVDPHLKRCIQVLEFSKWPPFCVWMQTQKSPNDPHIRIRACGCKFHHYQLIPHFKNFHSKRPFLNLAYNYCYLCICVLILYIENLSETSCKCIMT